MLIPAFNFKLQHSVTKGLVTCGKFDGQHPALIFGSGSQLLIHNPHDVEETLRNLNINRKVTSLASGNFYEPSAAAAASAASSSSSKPSSASSKPSAASSSSSASSASNKNKDTLFVGTQTNLLAYDVDRNSDLFFKDVPDGVHALLFGRVPSFPAGPCILAGGNCAIQGYDVQGNEVFWTVTGDNVSALAFCDVDEDGQKELLVGSEDFEIRIFQGEEVVSDVTEADVVTGLAAIRHTAYGYSLANGTIGVYNKKKKLWNIKSKNSVNAIGSFDLDADGTPELISAWANGKLEVRSDTNGELIYTDKFAAPLADLLCADYRCDGKHEIIAVACDGEVRGYLPADSEMGGPSTDSILEEKTLTELNQRKSELLNELKNYENNLKSAKSGKKNAGTIPADTECKITFEPTKVHQGLIINVNVTNDTVIKFVTLFGETLFDGESLIVHPRPGSASSSLQVPLRLDKDFGVDLHIKVVVGHRSSVQDHVFESVHRLPKFAAYEMVKPRDVKEPTSCVQCVIQDRINRVALWINQSFTSTIELNNSADSLFVAFQSLRTNGTVLVIRFSHDTHILQIKTDDMDLAGSVIQELCSYLGIADLESTADFPDEMESFRTVLMQVDEYNRIRLKLSAEIADNSNLIKALVIKAEDARMLNNMTLMKRLYSDLYDQNRELIGEYTKRANNHNQLLEALKEVNQMIQKAAKLRCGKFKAEVVSACRAAVKNNNVHALFKIIKSGKA